MAKTSKKTDFKEMSNEDLKNRVQDLKREYFLARQKTRMGQFKKISEFTRIRKEVARAQTQIRLREIAQEKTGK